MPESEMGRRTLEGCLDLWVKPELRRRGQNTDSCERRLRRALIVFDAKKVDVLLDDEVGVAAEVKLKPGLIPEIGSTIDMRELEQVELLAPDPPVDPNKAFVLLVRLGSVWHVRFDARYNLLRITHLLADAEQFTKAAEILLSARLQKPFIDCLFSAAEILAKCELLLIPGEFSRTAKESHRSIAVGLSEHPLLDPTFRDFRDAFKKVAGRRPSARYRKGELAVHKEECGSWLDAVQRELDYLRSKARPRKEPGARE
jgi:hypothetical protein